MSPEKWQTVLVGYKDSSQIIPTIAEEVDSFLSRRGIFEDDVTVSVLASRNL